MNTNTQPSEHAKFAGQAWLSPDNYPWSDLKKLIWHIDQHAIAPAVAERDKRIAELEEALQQIALVWQTQSEACAEGGSAIAHSMWQMARNALAKKGQP